MPSMTDSIAIALLSGGLDSATAAALAIEAGQRVIGLSFDYGQRHRRELEAASRLASTLGLAELSLEDTIELLGGTNPDHKKREGLEDMEKCQHVVKTVRTNLMELLDTSLNHIKKVKTEYKKSKYSLLPVIEETVAGLATHPQLKNKKINILPQGDSFEAVFNPLDIQRVLQNLIINAGYVTENGGKVDIGINKADRALKVSITDKGCGIPEEVQEYLFKDSLTTKSDGNGLGLLSCKGIIEENHQGKLWFETETGKGTTFHFTLPA